MREPFHQCYAHLVWATWDRLPLLTGERQKAVYACIQSECVQMKIELLAIGGIADHVHVLIRYAPSQDLSTVVKQIKGSSSHLATHALETDRFFKWQGGYGAFTLSKRDIPAVRAYILNQEEHHRNKTFDPDYELA